MKNVFEEYDLCPQQAAVWVLDKGARLLQHISNGIDYHGRVKADEDFHITEASNFISECRDLLDILENKIREARTSGAGIEDGEPSQ